jgi:hypothetical protein
MSPRCLFCRKPFPANGELRHFPHATRIAYDPERGRLWGVCGSCWRWTLWAIEERGAALDELEQAARDRGKLVARTANVSLLQLGGTLLIRVGDARLVEQAWWRYGGELSRRRASVESRSARLATYAWGALAYVGDLAGLYEGEVPIDWKDQPRIDIVRWRRFGWAAWHGRETCRYCNSTLRALRYDLSWWVYPREGGDGDEGGLELGVPCPRCDPWTPDHVYLLRGTQAEMVLRRCLAYQNVSGAPESRIRDAASAIEASGSAGAFARGAAQRGESLWKMRGTRALALEIALSESAERRRLDPEARAMDFMWRQEEEMAAIIDGELTPLRLAHRLLPDGGNGSV